MSKKTYSVDKIGSYENQVIVYADYIIDEINKGNSPSIRSIEKHFKEYGDPKYNRSYVTIYKLLVEVLPLIDYEKYVMIRKLFDKNDDKNKSIRDTKVRIRVMKTANLLLQGFTIDEIVNAINSNVTSDEDLVTFNTIYRDMTIRFKQLAQEENLMDKYLEVEKVLDENSMNNLANQNGNASCNNVSCQQRDTRGRFIK